jgi:hypothetical protein
VTVQTDLHKFLIGQGIRLQTLLQVVLVLRQAVVRPEAMAARAVFSVSVAVFKALAAISTFSLRMI